jgi:hypothetical protein
VTSKESSASDPSGVVLSSVQWSCGGPRPSSEAAQETWIRQSQVRPAAELGAGCLKHLTETFEFAHRSRRARLGLAPQPESAGDLSGGDRIGVHPDADYVILCYNPITSGRASIIPRILPESFQQSGQNTRSFAQFTFWDWPEARFSGHLPLPSACTP